MYNEPYRKHGRERVLAAVLLVCLGCFIARLVQLQVFEHTMWSELGRKQSSFTKSQKPRRGQILDRNGQPLALTLPLTYAVGYRPKGDHDKRQLARALAEILDVPQSGLQKKMDSAKTFVQLARGVDEQTKLQIERLPVSCLQLDEEARRSYPAGGIAAAVVGFTNVDEKGLEGIEASMDGLLSGRHYSVDWRIDALRAQVAKVSEAPAESLGVHVNLTIDLELQTLIEDKLRDGLKDIAYDRACCIMLDPATGDILALVTAPTFDPENPGSAPAIRRKCWPITDVYEPGSTLKILPVALALETHRLQRTTRIDCENGAYRFFGKPIKDTHAYKILTMDEVLAYSSNIGAAKIALRFEPAMIYDKLRAFGFGNPTQIEISGEQPGVVPNPAKWSNMTRVTLAYGHGMSCTALQLASAYAAIANGGLLMKPRLVRSIDSPTGGRIDRAPEAVRQAISPEVASELTDMLENVVEYGTGKALKVEGVSIAGKTGTARKVDTVRGGYIEGRYVSSFAGFFPSDKPRYVLYVVVDDTRGGAYYGGAVAGPIFRNIVEEMRAIGYTGMGQFSGKSSSEWVAKRDSSHSSKAAYAALPQTPRGSSYPAVTRVSSAGQKSADSTFITIPDVRGLSLRRALQEMRKLNLPVEIRGSSVVVEQLPAPGTLVHAGTVCELHGLSQ